MRLERVTIAGLRCFGPQSVRISLGERITTQVGPNASGKTSRLHALGRLFRTSRAQRNVVRSDFHLPPGADPEDRVSRILFGDVLVRLPELALGTATTETTRHLAARGGRCDTAQHIIFLYAHRL